MLAGENNILVGEILLIGLQRMLVCNNASSWSSRNKMRMA